MSWNDFLGLTIHDKSLEKYGPDVLLGKILYRIMYYDYSEDEIKRIRTPLENRNNTGEVELYKNLMRQIYVTNYQKNNILNLILPKELSRSVEEKFEELSSCQINSIICGALVSLKEKLSVLSDLKIVDKIYDNTYKAINNALSLLELKENEIFILKGQGIDKNNLEDKTNIVKTYEYFPLDNYKKAIEYIKKTCRNLFEYNKFEEMSIWFVLEKWTLNESGMYEKVISYYITLYGDIWLYEFDYEYTIKQENNSGNSSLLANIDVYADFDSLEIPTPYKFDGVSNWLNVVINSKSN